MRYQDLDVYKRSYVLAVKVHKWSLTLPKELQYDIGSQIRRASRSIPSNIAEGLGRHYSKKDRSNFLSMSLGSNDEVIFNLNFLKDVELMNVKVFEEFCQQYNIVGRELSGLIKSTSN